MNRILIIGSPCSGKSRLARAMGKKLSLPVVHLDKLWWQRGQKTRTREEFDAKLDAVLDQESWIMDGNYARTIDRRLDRCDAIVYLDFGRWTCLLGLVQRLFGPRGSYCGDSASGSASRPDWSCVKHIWHFQEHSRTVHYTYLAKATHAKSIVLKNRAQVRAFLQAL